LSHLQFLNVRNNLMENESEVIGVTDATAFVSWGAGSNLTVVFVTIETSGFYFSPQKNNSGGDISSNGNNNSTPDFMILTTVIGLLCALVLFKWQKNRRNK